MTTQTVNWLDKAALKASAPELKDVDIIRNELEGLGHLKSSLLDVESQETKDVDRRILSLRRELIKHKVVEHYKGDIALFDPEPMTWRDEEGFPRLVPFHPDSSEIVIGAGGNLPVCTQSFYTDIFQLMKERATARLQPQLKISFRGLIPESVRKKIRQSRSFFNETFILTEADGWEVGYIKVDPLVIGWDSQNFWLIDKFDTTPLERYAVEEFSQKP